jgi:hypothetical protein
VGNPRSGIAAARQGELAPVKTRIMKADVALKGPTKMSRPPWTGQLNDAAIC